MSVRLLSKFRVHTAIASFWLPRAADGCFYEAQQRFTRRRARQSSFIARRCFSSGTSSSGSTSSRNKPIISTTDATTKSATTSTQQEDDGDDDEDIILPRRQCAACGKIKEQPQFSCNQWFRTERIQGGRCRECIRSDRPIPPPETYLTTPSTDDGVAEFDAALFDNPENIYKETRHRYIAKGVYKQGGPRAGQTVLAKVFKTHLLETLMVDDHFAKQDVIGMRQKAVQLIDEWNDCGYGSSKHLIAINPPVSCRLPPGRNTLAGRWYIQEPYLENFEKYNSNTGWTKEYSENDEWNLILQAFSHFSHHASACQNLVCDLQGAVSSSADDDGNSSSTFVLTSPVVMSRRQDYGVADLGREGILSFFANHTCNRYCDSEWKHPNVRRQRYWRMQKSTLFRVRLLDGSDDDAFIQEPELPPPPESSNEEEETDSSNSDSEEGDEDDDDFDEEDNLYQEDVFDGNDLDDQNEFDKKCESELFRNPFPTVVVDDYLDDDEDQALRDEEEGYQ